MSRWQTFLRLTQHAHRVNESLAVVCDETVTKTQVLSVMRKDGAVSKKGTEKEGEEESREEQELVSDAQPQPSTGESALSTLLEEVRARIGVEDVELRYDAYSKDTASSDYH
ncbi:uncharacterized protein LACBIDRAFT_329702 [Laccaria bicolor S238N-H82]|uniref:Predicted protein n=1 Tax=Laccaria bicolor (strain S238N-H82 / ATCC MYA-4686) TaxID=486041 RepID=B0DIX4_LACBS|nr:uncharacterized protein LACBIDRAFT_329702 [Laccaria bicolor S238N-H82]EDR05307.1 predicted protein [Laccaria bicolor S238N-H82]|eukprot:XP_001883865.1 predicted protein [Laccaria bicolor S238N-H82]